MAINRISGDILESNLIRSSDLAFNTNLLYVDVTNGRIGVKTDSPGNFALDVNGNMRVQGSQTITGDLIVQGTTTTIDSQNLVVEDNIITINENASTATDAGIMISRAGENDAVFYWDEVRNKFRVGTTTSDGSTRTDLSSVNLARLQVAEPTADDDAAHKKYVDDQISTVSSGGTVLLGTPTDSTFGDGAFLGLDTSGTMTDAIDDLNETMENIRNGTYVKSVSFVSDSTSISLGDTVTLTVTTVPAADGNIRFTIDWGDGDTDVGSTDSTPSHTYNTASGSPMSVTVTAFDNTATSGSSGSTASSTRTNYITVASAAPVVGFQIHSTDDSANNQITTTDSGSTVYLQNTTTNTVSDCTYEVDWGDGTSDTVANDSVDGGAAGGRLAHTYTNSASADDSSVAGTGPGDTKYRIRLTLTSHSTAAPEQIPQSADANFEVYSTHTPKIDIADSTLRGVNEEGTSGFPRTFINGTDTLPGANSAFSATQRYTWDFTDDSTQTSVLVGSGSSGDTDQTISKTFGFSQGSSAGVQGSTTTYPVKLILETGHSTGTFESAITNIVVEPDVRANLAGAAVTTNTGSGDNSLSLYDVTDLDGTNRAIGRFTNTSQNADDYEYDFQNDSSDVLTLQEDGSTAGTIGNTLDKNFTGVSAGNIVTDFRATGTPDTIHQNDTQTVTFVMKATPSAPANLSAKTLTLNTSAQGTNPHLCANFDDATGSATTLAAGTSLESTTARRYTSTTPVETNTVTNFLVNNSNGTGSTVNQTVTASINASASGARTFTTSEGGANNATFTDLVITNHRDYDEVDSSYPQRLYLVATAKISNALTDYSAGLNAQRIESSAGGNTGYVHVVRDLLTGTPTTTIGTITETAGLSAGDYRYISGIKYYGRGNPSLTITGTTIANFTGQAYQDTSSPVEVTAGTNQESTSGNVLASNPTTFTYADIDGSSTMLSSSIPLKNTGVGSAYTIGNLTCPLVEIDDSTNIESVQQVKIRSKNANGTGSYSESSTKIQVYTALPNGLDDENASNGGGITVSDSLGAGFDDDAVRISGFGSLSGDTPSLNDSSNANYYTDHAWSGAVTVAGTNEAITRFGTIKHFTTDLSSGYLPAGPDLNTGRSGAQYYNFAFRRTTMANFNITLSGKVSGMFIAAPGTAIDSASGLNGWLDCSTTYGGSGVPGSDTGNGGNGSNGCAFNSGDRVIDGTTYSSQEFTFTLGTENATNATGNNILVRIKLESGDSITALSID